MTRDLREALRIPAGSAWNIGLKLRVFALDLIFLQTNDRKTCFLGPKTRQLSKTPGNFRKRTGTSPKHPGHFPNTPGTSRTHPGNFPNIPGTSQTHPELPKNTRNIPERPGNFPKTPVELPNTRGTAQKHPGRWLVVGGWVDGWVPTTPGEGPTGVDRTATWHIWHVSIADWSTSNSSLRGMPRGKNWHVTSPDWSTCHPLPRVKLWLVREFLMCSGVDTWQTRGRF